MTSYDNSGILFKQYTDEHGLLSNVLSIKICLTTQTEGKILPVGSWESVILKTITLDDSLTISSVDVYIDSPLSHISGTYSFNGTDGVLQNEDINSTVIIVLDREYSGINPGTYTVDGHVRLRCIDIQKDRKIGLDPGDGSSAVYSQGLRLNDGYNVAIRYNSNTGFLDIIGGPGQGLGRYSGLTDDRTAAYYSGVRSINGIRANHNVNIKLSDTLVEYGARVDIK